MAPVRDRRQDPVTAESDRSEELKKAAEAS